MRLKNINPNGHFSPRVLDFTGVRKVTEDGEKLVHVPTDINAIRVENGDCSVWSLSSLMKAGINPDSGIRTGTGTRAESFDDLKKFESAAAELFNSETDEKN